MYRGARLECVAPCGSKDPALHGVLHNWSISFFVSHSNHAPTVFTISFLLYHVINPYRYNPVLNLLAHDSNFRLTSSIFPYSCSLPVRHHPLPVCQFQLPVALCHRINSRVYRLDLFSCRSLLHLAIFECKTSSCSKSFWFLVAEQLKYFELYLTDYLKIIDNGQDSQLCKHKSSRQYDFINFLADGLTLASIYSRLPSDNLSILINTSIHFNISDVDIISLSAKNEF